MTLRQQQIANELGDANASRAAALRHASIASDYRAMQIETQARSARILAHGATDADEMRTLARLCDVPTTVLRHDLDGEVTR